MSQGFYRALIVYALASLLLASAACGLRRTQASKDNSSMRVEQEQKVSPAVAVAPVTYVAFGDSTGVGVGARKGGGYVARLFERIERARAGSSVKNFCVSGADTTDVLRSQLMRLDATHQPTLITLGIGINDVTHGLTPEQFTRNYEEIVTRIKSRTNAPIVVTNIPDISTAPRVPLFLHDQVQGRIRVFNERLAEIAARHELLLVDTYDMSREVIPKHPEFFSPDGFHPSDEGYEYWAKMMWPTVKSAIGEE
jgi:lysophospholipase L1-like esterase